MFILNFIQEGENAQQAYDNLTDSIHEEVKVEKKRDSEIVSVSHNIVLDVERNTYVATAIVVFSKDEE